MNSPKRSERGFTLMEMMVILIIIGIISAIAVPNMNKVFTRDKLRGSTTSVTTSLYLARLKAINESEPYGVRFSDDGSFQIVRDPNNDNDSTGTAYHLDTGLKFGKITFTNKTAIFTEQGQLLKSCLPTGDMTGTVSITDGTTDSTKVDVTFLSGRIRETNR
jgi:type II secretion system protein H